MMGPLDGTASAFLWSYALLFAVAAAFSVVAPRVFRPAGRERPVADADEAGMLAGGRRRLVDTATVRLLVAGQLEMRGRRRVGPVGNARGLPVNAEAGWSELARGWRTHADAVHERLQRAGLLVDASTLWTLRGWAALPFLLLLALGMVRLVVGMARGESVELLVLFLLGTAAVLAVRLLALDERTKGGRVVLASLRERHDRLRRAPTRGEMDWGVALFGTAVLAGSDLAPYHEMRTSSGGDGGGGGGGCGSSDGDGGGGCGGCGGD